MSQRKLYIVAYDVSCPRRLRRMLGVCKDYATGGQKSVFECFLSDGEKDELLTRIAVELDFEEDRFFVLRLDPRGKVRARGVAVKPADARFFYVG
jgi:CRISPR-associated protein Cas2